MRSFRAALLLSILLHGVILLAFPRRMPPSLPGAETGLPLPIRFVSGVNSLELTKSPKGNMADVKNKELTPSRRTPSRMESPSVGPDRSRMDRKPAAVAPAVAACSPETPAADPSAHAARRKEEGVPDAYRAMILARIAGEKRYPFRARRRGIEGEVTLRFLLLPDGGIRGCSVIPGPGAAAILREAALDSLRRAAPFPSPPPGCRKEGGVPMEVRIAYRLQKSP